MIDILVIAAAAVIALGALRALVSVGTRSRADNLVSYEYQGGRECASGDEVTGSLEWIHIPTYATGEPMELPKVEVLEVLEGEIVEEGALPQGHNGYLPAAAPLSLPAGEKR